MNNKQTYIVYLKPQSTFRGELRSDTLWGILCWGIRFLYGQRSLQNLLALYATDDKPFFISSAFPYLEVDGKKEMYFPRPFLPQKLFKDLPLLTREDALSVTKKRKEIKDISYISFETLKQLCEGASIDDMQDQLKESLNHKIRPSIKSDSTTHNSLNRLTNATLDKDGKGQLFHADERFVSSPKSKEDDKSEYSTGLFFLVQADDENWKKLSSVLRWLQHTGIGGDRNIGKGFFKITTEPFNDLGLSDIEADNINIVNNANAYMSLSLFMPSAEEITNIQSVLNSEALNYQITFRKGFVGHGSQKLFDKKNLAAFVEGSVFPFQMKGEIKDAGFKNSPYPLYQNGCAFMIPIHIKQNQPKK